jgi:hypothetical protein
MKTLLYLPLLFLFFNSRAQQSVLLKSKYLSNTTYSGAINEDVKAHIVLSGNQTILSNLQSQGISQPMTLIMVMKMKGKTQAGRPIKDGSFPINMQYKYSDQHMTVNEKNVPVPDKLRLPIIIYGHINPKGKLKADSTGGPQTDDTSEMHITGMIKMIQQYIKFPDQVMKPGYSFTETVPIDLPAAGNNYKVDTKITFKLVSITKADALFDVITNIDTNVPFAGYKIFVTGSGTGKMVYSIKNSFATNFSNSLNIKVTGTVMGLKIDAAAVVNMGDDYVVTH